MPLSSTTRKAGPFVGNDATYDFPFAFKVFNEEELLVTTTDSNGDETVLDLGSDYDVTLNAAQDEDPGGVVTLTLDPLAFSDQLMIVSAVQMLQGLNLMTSGGFYPKLITAAFDKVTILIQQLAEQQGRTLRVPVSDNLDSIELPALAARAGKALTFGVDGLPTATQYTVLNLTGDPAIGTPYDGSVTIPSLAPDVTLGAIAGLTMVAGDIIYATGAATYSKITSSAYGRGILAAANAAAGIIALGLGTMALETATDYVSKAGGVLTGVLRLNYATGGVNADEAGFRGVPITTHDANYSFVKDDAGRLCRHTSASTHAWTIEPFATSAIPVGAAIPVRNFGAGAVTLTRGAGVTLRIAGSATSANVTLAQYGMATLVHEAADVWVVSGVGIS